MPEYATVPSLEADQPDRRFERIIGKSSALESVLEQVEQVAPTDSTVLIEGETGTGKELIASLKISETARRNSPTLEMNPWRARKIAVKWRAGTRYSIKLLRLLRG